MGIDIFYLIIESWTQSFKAEPSVKEVMDEMCPDYQYGSETKTENPLKSFHHQRETEPCWAE